MIKGLAYFSGGKMVSRTVPIEIGVFMAIQGIDPGGYSALFKTKNLGVVMTKTNERFTRVRSHIKEGKPHVSYEIFLEGDLDEHYGSDKPVNSSAQLHDIERDFEEGIRKLLAGLIQKTQKDHSDIFGMGEMIRSHYPAFWKQHIHEKSDWETMYSTVDVDIKLSLHLRRVGLKDE